MVPRAGSRGGGKEGAVKDSGGEYRSKLATWEHLTWDSDFFFLFGLVRMGNTSVCRGGLI